MHLHECACRLHTSLFGCNSKYQKKKYSIAQTDEWAICQMHAPTIKSASNFLWCWLLLSPEQAAFVNSFYTHSVWHFRGHQKEPAVQGETGRLQYQSVAYIYVTPQLISSNYSCSCHEGTGEWRYSSIHSLSLCYTNVSIQLKVCKSVHHRTIQINHQPDATIFQFIILTYLQLNMFRAFSRPSSGAQWLQ
jgi:hypothetical protein